MLWQATSKQARRGLWYGSAIARDAVGSTRTLKDADLTLPCHDAFWKA
ncbi:hypothetical protein HC928_18685 [bacterium]|nr:hypothetical protein [bacterium]